MKRIIKQRPPRELISWARQSTRGTIISWGYDDMPSDVRLAVKKNLLREQGYLCCYTGKRISEEMSHIEHLKPQDKCIKHEDVDYKNLLAAYPAVNSQRACEFGAHYKKNWFDNHLFVHPLREDCEIRLRYRESGSVVPAKPEDTGAAETIKMLNLDHPELKKQRKLIIEDFLSDHWSKKQVLRFMKALDETDASGRYQEFCFVLKQVCERYLKRFD